MMLNEEFLKSISHSMGQIVTKKKNQGLLPIFFFFHKRDVGKIMLLSFLRNHVILRTFCILNFFTLEGMPFCVTDIKIYFHVLNSIKDKIIRLLFVKPRFLYINLK